MGQVSYREPGPGLMPHRHFDGSPLPPQVAPSEFRWFSSLLIAEGISSQICSIETGSHSLNDRPSSFRCEKSGKRGILRTLQLSEGQFLMGICGTEVLDLPSSRQERRSFRPQVALSNEKHTSAK